MNPPFTAILVPYDGSDPARAALELALAAMRPGTTLTLLTVIDESPIIAQSATTVMAYDPMPLFEALETQAKALLADASARCARSNVTARTETIHEQPVPGIVATARALGSDLIVMGTHARRGVARAFVGSTTEGVLRACDVPVLTTLAGESAAANAFRRALVAIDDSEPSDAALALARRLHDSLGTQLIAANVADTTRLYDNAATYGFSAAPLDVEIERESASVVARALDHAGLPIADVSVALLEGHPADVLVVEARNRAATLVVVGSHGRRGLRRFVLGSVAERIVRTSGVPVLVVRAHARVPVAHTNGDRAARRAEPVETRSPS
jgi:nucleotide-binding universal stress UspA family protein